MPTLLDGFRRYSTTPLKEQVGGAPSRVETHADELRHEIRVETVEDGSEMLPGSSEEEGSILRFDAPSTRTVTKVKITGQAVVIVRAGGAVVVDARGY